MKCCLPDRSHVEWCETKLISACQGNVDPSGSEFFPQGSTRLFSEWGCCLVPDLSSMEASGMSPHPAYEDVNQSHYLDTWFDAFKAGVDAAYLFPDAQEIALTPCGGSAEYPAISPSRILPALARSCALQAAIFPVQGLTAYSYSWD